MTVEFGCTGQLPATRSSPRTAPTTSLSCSIEGQLDPIAIDHAQGVDLYTPEGKRILDFNSELMSVNIGHGDRRVIDAITEQATKLQYVMPGFATEIRGWGGTKLAEIFPGDLDKVHARRPAPRRSRTRSSWPATTPGATRSWPATGPTTATFGAMTLTGDPRRWANEPGWRGWRVPEHPRLGRGRAPARRAPLQGLEERHTATRAPTRSRRSPSRRSWGRTGS